MNITSTCTSCKKNCASEELDCYILDNSGFIIISERHEHTGKFFGEIDGTIMDSLVQDRIYRKVTVVDYQGACAPQESYLSAAPRTLSSSIIKSFISMFGLVWSSLLRLHFYNAITPVFSWGRHSHDEMDIRNEDLNVHPQPLADDPTAGDEKPSPYPAVAPAPTAPPATSAQNTIESKFQIFNQF